jgi:hypothetical protein
MNLVPAFIHFHIHAHSLPHELHNRTVHNRPNRKAGKAKAAPKPRSAAPAGLFGGGGGGGGLFGDDDDNNGGSSGGGGGLFGSASSSAPSRKPASRKRTSGGGLFGDDDDDGGKFGGGSSGLKGGPGLFG